jgi:hypothetical protein
MRKGLTKYKEGDAKATALFQAAFGKKADYETVHNTVNALETGTIKAEVANFPQKKGEYAVVDWARAQHERGRPWRPGPIRFSDLFHGRCMSDL